MGQRGQMRSFKKELFEEINGFPLIGEKRDCKIKGQACIAEVLDSSNGKYKVKIVSKDTNEVLYNNIWLPEGQMIGHKT